MEVNLMNEENIGRQKRGAVPSRDDDVGVTISMDRGFLPGPVFLGVQNPSKNDLYLCSFTENRYSLHPCGRSTAQRSSSIKQVILTR